MHRTPLALLLALALATPAAAAPRRCAGDPRGDQTVPADTAMDLASGDFVADSRVVSVVVRTYALDPDPVAVSYRAVVRTAGSAESYVIGAEIGPTGQQYGRDGTGTGTYDLAKDEVRIHVKRADLPAHLRSLRGWKVTYESGRGYAGAAVAMDTYEGC